MKIGIFGWKTDLKKSEKMLTVLIEGIFLERSAQLVQLHMNVGLKYYHSYGFMVLNFKNHKIKSDPYLKQYKLYHLKLV